MAPQLGKTRRDVLKALGSGTIFASAAACAPVQVPTKQYHRPYSRQPWASPRISMDSVIRVVVGHRPYRPGGFVVKKEQIDAKTIIHNYGTAEPA